MWYRWYMVQMVHKENRKRGRRGNLIHLYLLYIIYIIIYIIYNKYREALDEKSKNRNVPFVPRTTCTTSVGQICGKVVFVYILAVLHLRIEIPRRKAEVYTS